MNGQSGSDKVLLNSIKLKVIRPNIKPDALVYWAELGKGFAGLIKRYHFRN